MPHTNIHMCLCQIPRGREGFIAYEFEGYRIVYEREGYRMHARRAPTRGRRWCCAVRRAFHGTVHTSHVHTSLSIPLMSLPLMSLPSEPRNSHRKMDIDDLLEEPTGFGDSGCSSVCLLPLPCHVTRSSRRLVSRYRAQSMHLPKRDDG